MLKLEFLGKNNIKTMQNSVKKWKNVEKMLFLVLSGDHPIELKSLDFIE